MIFDNGMQGSVGTSDPIFPQVYGRGYFGFTPDTARRTLAVSDPAAPGGAVMFTARYDVPSPDTVRLWTKLGPDSVYAELVRSPRHFQLAERQFHWLSEYNR